MKRALEQSEHGIVCFGVLPDGCVIVRIQAKDGTYVETVCDGDLFTARAYETIGSVRRKTAARHDHGSYDQRGASPLGISPTPSS